MGNKNKVFGLEHNPKARLMPKMFGMDHTPDNFRSSVYIETEEQDALATFKFDLIHRDDGPAWIDEMSKEYYQFGYRHHRFTPAVIEWNTSAGYAYLKKQARFLFGDLHAPVDNKPALIFYYPDGVIKTKRFAQFNLCHRKDGPAVIEYDYQGEINSENYYQFGLEHRDSGPSRIFANGFEKTIRFAQFDYTHRENGPAIVNQEGDEIIFYSYIKFYCLHSDIDTVSRSSILTSSKGFKREEYFRFDKYHRLNGPAFITESKTQDDCISTVEKYYKMGVYSRIDGPAVINVVRRFNEPPQDLFYIAGENFTQHEFYKLSFEERQELERVKMIELVKRYLIDDFAANCLHNILVPKNLVEIDIFDKNKYPTRNDVVNLHDDYETTLIESSGNYPDIDGYTFKTIWKFKMFKLHSDDGPAYERIIYNSSGKEFQRTQIWIQFGKIHREDGPAIIIENDSNKTSLFLKFGYLHRDNGPALVKHSEFESTIEYYQFNHLHRNGDLPASIYRRLDENGNEIYYRKKYWQFGKLHRKNDPAVIIKDSSSPNVVKKTERFYYHNIIHNEDGPAEIITQTSTSLSPLEKYNNIIFKKITYCRFGYLHRDSGPAKCSQKNIVLNDGSVKSIKKSTYCQFGEIHRDEGPAENLEIKYKDKEKRISIFKKFNKIHRDFGSAIINTERPLNKYYLMGCLITQNNIFDHLESISRYYEILMRPRPKYFHDMLLNDSSPDENILL